MTTPEGVQLSAGSIRRLEEPGEDDVVENSHHEITVGHRSMTLLITHPAAEPRLSLLEPGVTRMPAGPPGPLTSVAFIGNSLPRRCGIATFTADLQQAVANSAPKIATAIVAMTDPGGTYLYPDLVKAEIGEDRPGDYLAAADFLNYGGYEVVSLQHEFGIFGGEAGEHILRLLDRLTVPVVTTLHTVLAEPSEIQRRVLRRIVAASARVVVMAEKGRALLQREYGVPAGKIAVIPHGVPDYPFVEPDQAKERLGFAGRTVILTFGLLSPNKGIEIMIEAMPSILTQAPDAVYVVLGATHPNLVRREGEAYRERLLARTRDLGIQDHVVFLDEFVDRPRLLDFISMCDVYVTPYLNAVQMTSGTLAYSFGLGKPVVSTPFWHATELLADGRGILVPFGDSEATGVEIGRLLIDPARRQAIRERAYAESRSMTWEHTAQRYLDLFQAARRPPLAIAPADRPNPPREQRAVPDMRINHLLALCDDTGLFQHAVYSVPDRLHGYCIDDNARALLVACALNRSGEQPLPEPLAARFAAFLQHAWNPDNSRFRNFMSFERRWVEEQGSEDSHGRAVWALGECVRSDASPSRRQWAAELFAKAAPAMEVFRSPRAWAFALLGLDGYCAVHGEDQAISRLRRLFAERLMERLAAHRSPDWVWFEEVLAYDNARLPQALIITGLALGDQAQISAGLAALHWLKRLQISPAGFFRPVGSDSFGAIRALPRPFDQQAIEATAMVSAALAADRAEPDHGWPREAKRAFDWFLGDNDLAVALVDLETGSCRDGLHSDRANENRGGESVVSYLLSLAEIRFLARQATALTPRESHPSKEPVSIKRDRFRDFVPIPETSGRRIAASESGRSGIESSP